MSDEELEGVSDPIKEVLKHLKKRKISRNDPCPCESGKKYKKCCLGKDFKEINELFWKNKDEKSEIIKGMLKYPDGAFIVPELDTNHFSVSNVYGPYKFRDYALYFSRNKITMNDEQFKEVFEKIRAHLEKDHAFDWRTNLVVDIESKQIREIEFIFMAFRKEFIIKAMEKSEFVVTDMLSFQIAIVNYIAQIIHDYLNSENYTSSYPRQIKDLEKEKDSILKEGEKNFFLESRPTQKLLYMTTLLIEIEQACQSKIEVALARELAVHNIPFIQHVEITKSFPERPPDERLITKPDMLLWNDVSPIAIYCDGHDFHNKTKEQVFRDRNIDRELIAMNFIVLRFTGAEIYNNVERCIENIKQHFLGSQFSKTPQEVLARQLSKIDHDKLNTWEERFVNSLWDYVTSDKRLSLNQERKLKQILDKASYPSLD